MIQRIQSVYLLLVALLNAGLMLVFSLWSLNNEKVYPLDLFSSESLFTKSIPILIAASGVLAIVAIFQFKNRQLQFVMGRINILINLLLLGLLIYQSMNLPGEDSASEKGIGMFLPIVAVLLCVLANKAIKKDEDLVKSVDRLR